MYRYRLTRLGFHFVFVALFAIVGGSLRGFNLLLVLAGLLVAVVIVQWRQGRAAIRQTRVRRPFAQGNFAGTPVSIRYEVVNVARWLPIWSIRLEDRLTARRLPHSNTSAVPDHIEPSVPLFASIGNVPGGQSRTTTILCRVMYRGVYDLGPLVASTHFPFCLMNCERLPADSLQELYVYPRLLELRRGWTALLPPKRGGDATRSSGGAGQDGEFFGLRPWQSGDHVKYVHWRTTARIGEPAVRQFERRNRHQICVIADCVLVDESPDAVEAVETVLRLSATLLNELSTKTKSVSLLLADAAVSANDAADANDAAAEPLCSIGNQLQPLLRRLAVAKACVPGKTGEDPLARISAAASQGLNRYAFVVVSSRRFEDAIGVKAAARTPARRRSVWRSLEQAGRLSWIDVNSPKVRHFLSGEKQFPTPESSRGVKAHAGR